MENGLRAFGGLFSSVRFYISSQVQWRSHGRPGGARDGPPIPLSPLPLENIFTITKPGKPVYDLNYHLGKFNMQTLKRRERKNGPQEEKRSGQETNGW